MLFSRKEKRNDAVEMLYQDAKHERDKRHYYRNLVLRSVSAFFIGSILLAFLEARGLREFLLAAAVGALCFLYAKVS